MFPLHEPLDEDTRESLKAFDDFTAAYLARRGVRSHEAAERFLAPSYDTHLHDPLTMTDMPKAAERLAKAILSGEHLCVWSDYDCDGIPGAVLLHDFFKKVGASFENYIPHRHAEGYGVNVPGVEKIAKRASLMITVDSGITDLPAIARATELGLDVIVTDHHLPFEALPEAYAVVNPNARAEESYPFRGLCGTGVAWKLVCATLSVSPELRARVGEGWEKWLLDMVALASVADLVPLTGENRVLVTYGLVVLRKSPRIGLQKLCRALRIDQRRLTEDDVAFMIAPRVNAASRVGDAWSAFELFTTTDETRADALVKVLERDNRKRKAEAGAITRAVHARVKSLATLPQVIVCGESAWRPSLLGLVASNIADEFERPVLLWGREGNGALKGSARSGGRVHILELMRATENCFEQCGGHAAAGGFTVIESEIFSLQERVERAYETIATKSDADILHADVRIAPHEATHALLGTLEKLAPFGIENEKPMFLLPEVSVLKVSRFGKNEEHIKLVLEAAPGKTIEAVTFFAKGALAKRVAALASSERVSLVAHLERDTFTRGGPVRLRLLDLKPS